MSLNAPRFRRLMACAVAASLLHAGLLVPLTAQAQNSLPSLGDTASEDFGIAPEKKLGEQIMREIRRDPDYLDDPLLLDYVKSVWQPLVDTARAQGNLGPDVDQRFAFEIFLVRDRSVNAFALPGGYVGVHTGLIAMTSSRDELAAVLAHELTHITQRHIARGFANSKRQGLISLASLIIGVLAASRSGTAPDTANAVIAGGQAAAIQGQLNFSRDMEREADRIGYSVLRGAGYAPAGMASMFEKLAQSSRLNDNGSFPYLRSHPLTSERLGEARSRLELGAGPDVAAISAGASAAASTGSAAPPRTWLHTAAQAYARVLSDPRVDSLRRWQSLESEACRPTRRTDAALVHDAFGACLQSAVASNLLREGERADAALGRAISLMDPTMDPTIDPTIDPAKPGAATAKSLSPAAASSGVSADQVADMAATRRWLDLLKVQALLARGALMQAALLLKPQLATCANSRPCLLLSAQLAAASGQTIQDNADALQQWLVAHPTDSLAWANLAPLWRALGHRLRAVRAEAESRYALGDITGALDRLRSAQALIRSGQVQDHIEASVVDARARDLQAIQKRLLEDSRLQ